ncbi:MAG TPA: HlyD family efflux transporter periplasmic adaptor subunit, partial [Ramlibacter sp.]|uniref:HlyD family secretion protein n=1 Tax=Ramlibacter sp. TaxID=1917967 RepID=UPI002ED39E97
MKTANRIALGAAAAGIVLAAAWALRAQPVPVETATVTRGAFEQSVIEDGKTRVRDRYVISAPLAGTVQRIGLRAGDPIRAGQVVAVLAPTAPAFLDERAERELDGRLGTAGALQRRAAAERQRSEAQLDQARLDALRSRKLAADGFLSPMALEQAELALRTADKTLEAAQFAEDAARHEVEQARAALTRYRAESAGRVSRGARWEIRSPVAGSVLRVIQESEGSVPVGAALIEVADARSLEGVVDVLSQDAVGIRPGMPARIELGSGVGPLAASVRRVEPSAFTKVSALGIEEQRVNVILDFEDGLDRIHTIGDGFRMQARIVVFRVED